MREEKAIAGIKNFIIFSFSLTRAKIVTVDGVRHKQWSLPEEPTLPDSSYGKVGKVGVPDGRVDDDDNPTGDSTVPSMPTTPTFPNKELGRPEAENESTSNIYPTGEDIPNEVTI